MSHALCRMSHILYIGINQCRKGTLIGCPTSYIGCHTPFIGCPTPFIGCPTSYRCQPVPQRHSYNIIGCPTYILYRMSHTIYQVFHTMCRCFMCHIETVYTYYIDNYVLFEQKCHLYWRQWIILHPIYLGLYRYMCRSTYGIDSTT